MLVAAPPYLLYLRDNDGNDQADQVDTLMGGFATGNLQHNYNGLTFGMDNWIYAVNGGNSGKPYWWGDTSSVMDMRGQDFRFQLETKKWKGWASRQADMDWAWIHTGGFTKPITWNMFLIWSFPIATSEMYPC